MELIENAKLLKDMAFCCSKKPFESDRRRMQRYFLTVFLTASQRCRMHADFLPSFAPAERGRVLALDDVAKKLLTLENT
jgi:hypothetical protein